MTGVRIIKKDAIESAPESVQRYVRDWFHEGKVLGIPCCIASTTIGSGRPGVAPRHDVDTRRYAIGDESLNDWWRRHERSGITADLYADDEDARHAIDLD